LVGELQVIKTEQSQVEGLDLDVLDTNRAHDSPHATALFTFADFCQHRAHVPKADPGRQADG
jgi:hypothetical protein